MNYELRTKNNHQVPKISGYLNEASAADEINAVECEVGWRRKRRWSTGGISGVKEERREFIDVALDIGLISAQRSSVSFSPASSVPDIGDTNSVIINIYANDDMSGDFTSQNDVNLNDVSMSLPPTPKAKHPGLVKMRSAKHIFTKMEKVMFYAPTTYVFCQNLLRTILELVSSSAKLLS